MKKIANYDTVNYDYSTYWKGREYEHQAELLVLNKMLKGESGEWFLDIGGSFGRLLPTYYKKYSHPVIVDYSLKTLQKEYLRIKKKYPEVEMLAANAYSLPFKENSFDACMMVRVLHHINSPKSLIKEVHRILHNGSLYFQEFANKAHIKAVIRSLAHLDFSVFDRSPYQQPKKGYNEGARKDVKIPFINYHTKYITKIISSSNFSISKKYGCSFLRLDILKRIFSTNILLSIENFLQNTVSFLNLSPSIFLKSFATKKSKVNQAASLEELLVCPKCKGSLIISNNSAECKDCNLEFSKKKNIWDFRI